MMTIKIIFEITENVLTTELRKYKIKRNNYKNIIVLLEFVYFSSIVEYLNLYLHSDNTLNACLLPLSA